VGQELSDELHALEREFGLSAREILNVINQRKRCKIAVRGAIAEEYLLRSLSDLQAQGVIERHEDLDIDGQPDVIVQYAGCAYRVECKNVEKEKRKTGISPITIDFQRTRAPKGKPWERYYDVSEFEVIAACLWNRTHQWEFRYAATRDLKPHLLYGAPEYGQRLDNHVTVEIDDSAPWIGRSAIWTSDLPALLARLMVTDQQA